MSFLSGGGMKGPQINYTPPSFSSTGITGTYTGGGGYAFGQTPFLSSMVSQLQSTFGKEASAFGNLAKTVQPGFSLFRQAGLQDIENTRQQTLSNLSDTLAQRRILGSSFANSQVSQANADFAQKKAEFEAQSYLQELQASNQLTQEQFQAASQKFSTSINEMNFEADVAARLTAGASNAMASVAEAQAKLDAQNAQGIGSFFGSIASQGIGAFGRYAGSDAGSTALTSLFGGGGSAAGGAAAAGGASAFDSGAAAIPFLAA